MQVWALTEIPNRLHQKKSSHVVCVEKDLTFYLVTYGKEEEDSCTKNQVEQKSAWQKSKKFWENLCATQWHLFRRSVQN
jgi:hypothetical protein